MIFTFLLKNIPDLSLLNDIFGAKRWPALFTNLLVMG